MANKYSFETCDTFIEFVCDVGQTSKASLPVHGEPAVVDIIDCQAVVSPQAEQVLQPLRDHLESLLEDRQLLKALSARQLYALFVLQGTDVRSDSPFGVEVAQRRYTDPSNPIIRLLAEELGNPRA